MYPSLIIIIICINIVYTVYTQGIVVHDITGHAAWGVVLKKNLRELFFQLII